MTGGGEGTAKEEERRTGGAGGRASRKEKRPESKQLSARTRMGPRLRSNTWMRSQASSWIGSWWKRLARKGSLTRGASACTSFCTIEECLRMTGKPPVPTKWADINKATAESPEVRCRLVARDLKIKGEGFRDDLFASMPEAKRLLFQMTPSTWKARSSDNTRKIMLNDVKKAHLNGVADEDGWACIELSEGGQIAGDARETQVVALRHATRRESLGGGLLREVAEHQDRRGKGRSHDIPPSCVERALSGTRRRT